jgi:hypothetical protein
MNEDGLDQLEADIVSRLQADEWFSASRQLPDLTYATIPVISDEAGDIDTMIEKAIAELGLCVTVKVVEARVNHTEIGGPYFDPIEIVLLVVENVLLNRGDTGTQKRGKATALRAGALCSLWQPPSLDNKLITPDGTSAYKQVSDEGGIVQHNYRLQGKGGLNVNLPQVATPEFTGSDTQVTAASIACATPGAAIFYTIDGRHPSPRTGTLLVGGFMYSPFVPVTIKARAFLAGYRDSAIVTKTFTS